METFTQHITRLLSPCTNMHISKLEPQAVPRVGRMKLFFLKGFLLNRSNRKSCLKQKFVAVNEIKSISSLTHEVRRSHSLACLPSHGETEYISPKAWNECDEWNIIFGTSTQQQGSMISMVLEAPSICLGQQYQRHRAHELSVRYKDGKWLGGMWRGWRVTMGDKWRWVMRKTNREEWHIQASRNDTPERACRHCKCVWYT